MIYNYAITGVNESSLDALLEEAENRFENYTMAEATAIVVGEQEANWGRFMVGVGLDELATVAEGAQVIYEGARFDKFIAKAKAYFEMAKNKIVEITKRFIARVAQVVTTNKKFLDMYRSKLKSIKNIPEDFSFRGYTFKNSNLDAGPNYNKEKILANVTSLKIGDNKYGAASTISDDNFNDERIEAGLTPGAKGNTFQEKLIDYFYGEKEKQELSIDIDEQIRILENTKKLKDDAKKSMKASHEAINKIIKNLKEAEKSFNKNDKKEDLEMANDISKAFSTLLTYWKSYSSHVTQMHGTYMTALSTRNRQAKAICTKLLTQTTKEKGKADRDKIKARTESFVNTEAFLGAVEFI